MSRYIDADALKAEFPHDEDWDYPVNTNSYVVEAINSAPSIDIVRCKECKYWKGDGVFTLNALGEEEKLCKWWSKFGTIRTAETDFCSYGERSRR